MKRQVDALFRVAVLVLEFACALAAIWHWHAGDLQSATFYVAGAIYYLAQGKLRK